MLSVPPHKTTSAALTEISYLKTNKQQQNPFTMTEVHIKEYVLSNKLILSLISNYHSLQCFKRKYFQSNFKVNAKVSIPQVHGWEGENDSLQSFVHN